MHLALKKTYKKIYVKKALEYSFSLSHKYYQKGEADK